MKVYIAEEAGFCFGVKRALNIIDNLHEKGQQIHIFGQLIHNRSVLDDLKARGIFCINSLDQRDPEKSLIIRTHGIPVDTESRLKSSNQPLVDATCPLVKKLQEEIRRQSLLHPRPRLVIVGDAKHPEIIAARSYAPDADVVGSEDDARQLCNHSNNGNNDQIEHISVVAQTTLDVDFFDKILSILETKTKNLTVHNTICNATRVRQEAVKKLAPRVDFMMVIGGKNSSNTKKLFNIASQHNQHSFHIESYDDLKDVELLEKVAHFESVGITAGASTPPNEIEKVKHFFTHFNMNNFNKKYKNKFSLDKEMNHGRTKRDSRIEH
jgi:4-hydroxy-3-methylbut-2-en-1-yl diphosphate reductase